MTKVYAKRGGASFLYNYLQDAIHDPTINNFNDGSVTHVLSFIYISEEGNEHELEFRINCRPIDKNKDFVNISFEYPDPDDPLGGEKKVFEDKFVAVPNRNDVIVKKCQKFLSEVFDVDSIENLPENLTASVDAENQTTEIPEDAEEVTGGVISDAVEKAAGDLKTKSSGFLGKLFSDLFKKTRHLEIQDTKKSNGDLVYTVRGVLEDNDGDPQVDFPAGVVIHPVDASKKTIDVVITIPDPENFDGDPQEFSKKGLENSKTLVEKEFWKTFDSVYHDEELMKKFAEKFAVNSDSFTKEIDETKEEVKGEPQADTNSSVEVDTEEPETKSEVTEVESTTEAVDPTQNLRIGLKKVKSSTGYDIVMQAITASYDPTLALADVGTLIGNDEFVESLPLDADVIYDVISQDDELSVDPVEDFPTDNLYQVCRETGYNAILDAAYKLLLSNQYLGFMASGPQMSTIQNYTMNYSWRIQDIIDTVSHMILEENFVLEHPAVRISRIYAGCDQSCGAVTWDSFLAQIKYDIQSLIDALDLYYCNYTSDKQNTMLGWIRTWRHEIDYVLNRGL